MKIVSKDFCTLAGVYIAIYMGPCRRSSIVLVWKFRTSKMLDKWSPTYKLSHIKLSYYQNSQYFFSLALEPTCPPYLLKLFFNIFKSFPVFILLSIGLHVNFADLDVSVRLSIFRIIFPRFLRTGISPDFTWILLAEFLGGFFSVYFLLGLRKKKTWKKICKKCSTKFSPYSLSIYSFKGKCNFCNPDNCFRKIKWLT